MKPFEQSSKPQPLITQTENNTTLWIGHLHNYPTDHFGGQTFFSPADGFLDNIQLFASAISCPGEIEMSFHEFDMHDQTWKPVMGQSVINIKHKDRQKWIRFDMPALWLTKEKIYGFRLRTRKAMIGFGEAAHDTDHPFSFGNEWHGSSVNEKGYYYSYFSMMFRVEMRT